MHAGASTADATRGMSSRPRRLMQFAAAAEGPFQQGVSSKWFSSYC